MGPVGDLLDRRNDKLLVGNIDEETQVKKWVP